MYFSIILMGLCCFSMVSTKEEQYQDIIINNDVISYGVRDCSKRYEAIKPILAQYKRPITVLDIGASQGYFSFRIAHDFDATCVMIEGNYDSSWHIADQLLKLCKLNTDLDNIIFLNHKINATELERLASCEHFDVVLAFNIIHHLGADWQKAAQAIVNLGDTIIVETPPADDPLLRNNPNIARIEQYLVSQGGKTICEIPRHTDPTKKGKMLLLNKSKKTIERPYWIHKDTRVGYEVKSTYTRKELYYKNKKLCDWQKGINLLTFYMLDGVYPTKETVKETIKGLSKKYEKNPHKDFMMWNLILQGNNVVAIDDNNEKHRFVLSMDDALCLLNGMIDQSNPADLIKYLKMQWYPMSQKYKINPQELCDAIIPTSKLG